MLDKYNNSKRLYKKAITVLIVITVFLCVNQKASSAERPNNWPNLRKTPLPKSELDLESIPFKIIYESFRSTDGKENWELYIVNADGSNPVNCTNTPDIDELYPHASPDGTKICFVVDEGSGRDKVRSVYYMNIDGTGRIKVAHNARQPCWSPDGKTIAYLKAEFERYTIKDFATKGLFFYDLKTKKHRNKMKRKIH